jgi:hypothetical protein
MRVQIDELGDDLIMSLDEQDKAMLIVMGLQYCLNEGIVQLNGKDLAQLAGEISVAMTDESVTH